MRSHALTMKKHILLIERSHEGYLELMKVIESAQFHCKVTYTTSYEHALQMLEYLVPDCILMRVDISEESTIDCIKRIRDHEALRNSMIVLYDEEVSGEMIRRSITQGADYCIDRPCSYADINYLLKDLFDRHCSNPDHSFEC